MQQKIIFGVPSLLKLMITYALTTLTSTVLFQWYLCLTFDLVSRTGVENGVVGAFMLNTLILRT